MTTPSISHPMFQGKGEKLVTATTNKDAIADMVAHARTKQWEGLKLTGSQEFRREAWLQAESQGMKTQGYTPRQEDLAQLKELAQQRSPNAIAPLHERKQQPDRSPKVDVPAPRHDLHKNQAAIHTEATKAIGGNLQALQKQTGMSDKSVEQLTKLAYWRGVVQEETKLLPKPAQDEAVARFDKQAQNPQLLRRIDHETKGTIDDRSVDRMTSHDTPEHSH